MAKRTEHFTSRRYVRHPTFVPEFLKSLTGRGLRSRFKIVHVMETARRWLEEKRRIQDSLLGPPVPTEDVKDESNFKEITERVRQAVFQLRGAHRRLAYRPGPAPSHASIWFRLLRPKYPRHSVLVSLG